MNRFVPRVISTFLLAMALGSAQGADAPGAGMAGTIPYISGGIGEAEQERFAAREKEFNLKLVFSLVESASSC